MTETILESAPTTGKTSEQYENEIKTLNARITVLTQMLMESRNLVIQQEFDMRVQRALQT